MGAKSQTYTIKGMQRDLSMSKFNPEFAYENYNIRITARGNKGSLLSLTNEKGNKLIANGNLDGTFIGGTTLNNYLILFTINKITSNSEIIRYDFSKNPIDRIVLFSGKLGFNKNNPIEALPLYETDNVQKVYWVDGVNQARVINIVKEDRSNWTSASFDFLKDISKESLIGSTKISDNSGSFSPGVIQYVFTAYNIFGSETHILSSSNLMYLTSISRGSSPEEKVTDSMEVSCIIDESSTSFFDYLRVYSISRTSLNGTPLVKRVTDIKLSKGTLLYSFYDNGAIGDIIDPTFLFYLGGSAIYPYTISQKDNTLFLGNYSTFNLDVSESISPILKTIPFDTRIDSSKSVLLPDKNGNYPYLNQLSNSIYSQNSDQIKYFKAGNYYRCGIQLQNKTGEWSDPIFIRDVKVDIKQRPKENLNTAMTPYIIAPISVTIVNKILELNPNFINIRPVVVYPSSSERETLCQGLVCPTVFNVKDRRENNPFVQSSWFSRPQIQHPITESLYLSEHEYEDMHGNNIYNLGTHVVSAPYCNIPANYRIGAEIQNIRESFHLGFGKSISRVFDYGYFVDSSIVTFHSPDSNNVSYENTKFRIVGVAPITSNQSAVSIQADNLFESSTSKINSFPSGTTNPSFYGGTILGAKHLWRDKIYDWKSDSKIESIQNFVTYPWHRNGSLNNGIIPSGEETRKSILKHKKTSNLRYSFITKYLTTLPYTPKNSITTPLYCDSEINPSGFVKINNIQNYPLQDLVYKWDIDKVSTSTERYNIMYADTSNPRILYFKDLALKTNSANNIFGQDPVSIKYKSDKHLVFAFNSVMNADGERLINVLPFSKQNDVFTGSAYVGEEKESLFFWEDAFATKSVGVHQEEIALPELDDNEQAYFFIGEIYRELNEGNLFGGTSKEALKNNIWVPCGSSMSLKKDSELILKFTEGDTYYQRYDCLKTYPYTLEDTNSIVDIVSFMCESYVNLDGRYDRNRGKKDNLAVSPLNFNLFNSVYSQQNNFFTSRILDKELLKNTVFKNSIVWSKQKTVGEVIDTWTNISLVSSLDMDGDKGPVTAIRKLNNELYSFQDKGISRILFNSRVQIPTSESVPIEIGNSMKVDGKVYLTTDTGCQNKWSITTSQNGLYFIDNLTNSLYKFNGQNIDPLSDKLGFRTFMEDQNSLDVWTPANNNNFIGSCDNTNKDIYFTNKNYCVGYSELLDQFTSFYSYESSPYMFNILGSFYSIDPKNTSIWKHEDGDYNHFYNNYKPYSISIIGNPDFQLDKIYNTIDYRADVFKDNTSILVDNETFTKFRIEDTYQNVEVNLSYNSNLLTNLKRRFRTWRIQIPRSNALGRGQNIDRIRNNWVKITLTNHKDPVIVEEIPFYDKNRMELHDLNLNYFV